VYSWRVTASTKPQRNPEWAIAFLRDAVANRRCVPFVGAGASIVAGGPSWPEYLEQLADGLAPEFGTFANSTESPIDIAAVLNRQRWFEGLEPVPVRNGPHGQINHELALWGCPLYLTTNYDTRLDNAVRSLNERAEIKGNRELADLRLSTLFSTVDSPPCVVKLCCTHGGQNPGVATRLEFAELVLRNPAALELMLAVLRCYSVIFVGCSMEDPLLNLALDRALASDLGFGPHFALLPPGAGVGKLEIMAYRGVTAISTAHNKVVERLAKIGGASKVRRGLQLLVFEPGTAAKARQVLESLHGIPEVTSVDFITSNLALKATTLGFAQQIAPHLDVRVYHTTSLEDLRKVRASLSLSPTANWDGFFCPYELAIQNASSFAADPGVSEEKLRFHSPFAAALTRNKSLFRKFVSERFSADPELAAIPFAVVAFSPADDVQILLRKIEDSLHSGFGGNRSLVVKPPNAAGSIGVRPIDLDSRDRARANAEDLRNVLLGMPFREETAHCAIDSLIVEQRLTGEEFSVESRKGVGGVVTPLAIHWKVDIDADEQRFFERLFVTLPPQMPPFALLRSANDKLLTQIEGLQAGVCHAEFRVDLDKGRVYPIEVGLRPGGGMVNYSVERSCGLNLFEAALRAALGVEQREALAVPRVVGTGLVFAHGRGILRLLRVKKPDGSEIAIGRSDKFLLRDCLNVLLASADRRAVYESYLLPLFGTSNSLRSSVVKAFDTGMASGLNASVELAEVWLEPGDLVSEEEAAYVAGILIVVDQQLSGAAAVAEAIAAVEFCLRSITCAVSPPFHFAWEKTQVPLGRWRSEYERTAFRSEPDSWTFSRGITLAASLFPKEPVIDVGCGSAIPALDLISSGRHYLGVDISQEAVQTATRNISRISTASASIILDDAEKYLDWLSPSTYRGCLLVANLPYLPAPPGVLRPEVDGGPDGMRLIPGVLIEIAKFVEARAMVVNVSSLCDLAAIARRLTRAGFTAMGIVGSLASLGEYSLAVKVHLESLRKGELRRFVGHRGDKQIIYSIVLARENGLPADTAFRDAERSLLLADDSRDVAVVGRLWD
jgi:precorrin-6B methylase 2